MKKAIVSVLIGNYDRLKHAPKYKGWDVILITDINFTEKKGWKLHKVNSTDSLKDSRYYKWMLHKILPKYDLYCYIDASMELLTEPPSDQTFFTHPKRRHVRREAEMILKLGKDTKQKLNEQLNYYAKEKFKDNFGLFQNGFFVRRNEDKINKVCEVVNEITQTYSHRDQLALPFALFKTNYKLEKLVSGRNLKTYYKLHKHGGERIQKVNVHHITPGRSDLNLGKAINDIIRLLPDEDWICLRDIDTMPAYHEVFFKQCEEIAEANEFDFIGCMTNRLGLKHQLHNGKMSEDTNWKSHRNIAKERYKKYGSKVNGTNEYIAGLFMLFPKKLWLAVGGFPEGGIKIKGAFIDYHFSKAVKDKGFKTGIAQGVYLIHLYRPDAKFARRAIQHLI
jgi:hypothetical protein